jgi:type I restriction enzyme M protein
VTRQLLRDKFVAVLTQLGGSAGNGRLREALGWAEATYETVKEELIGDGVVTPGRRRGGSVAIAAVTESPPAAPAKLRQTDRPTRTERPNGTGANVGYEAELWRMADALRGGMDAAEYKHIALGLLFLKYISDAFEEKHARLEAEK